MPIPARVYSTGMSNGGFFTARLICEMADRIAAAVSVAGTYHPESCDPARDVPYMAIHGTQDAVVPYLGGESVLDGGGSDADLRVFFEQVMPEEFAEFAADAGCDVTTVDTNVGNDVIQHAYTGCDGDTPMIFDEVRGGGHTWPSSPMSSVHRRCARLHDPRRRRHPRRMGVHEPVHARWFLTTVGHALGTRLPFVGARASVRGQR